MVYFASFTSNDKRVSIGMNNIHKVSICLVQPHIRCVAFKQRSRRIQASDATQVLQLLANKPRDMCSQREANQVGVIVYVNACLRAYLLYQGSNLNNK